MENTMTLLDAQNLGALTVADVLTAYSGKAGKCMCGCAGTYRTTAANREANAARRGYAVTDDEVNERQVAKVLRLVQANVAQAEAFDGGFAVDLDGRTYAVYYAENALLTRQAN